MANADNLRDASPWHPIKDAVDLKHLGKFAEELGECTAAVSRCIIQGLHEVEPETKKPNIEWLEDEIADVQDNIFLNVERFGLNPARMLKRMERKIAHLRQWHGLA